MALQGRCRRGRVSFPEGVRDLSGGREDGGRRNPRTNDEKGPDRRLGGRKGRIRALPRVASGLAGLGEREDVIRGTDNAGGCASGLTGRAGRPSVRSHVRKGEWGSGRGDQVRPRGGGQTRGRLLQQITVSAARDGALLV